MPAVRKLIVRPTQRRFGVSRLSVLVRGVPPSPPYPLLCSSGWSGTSSVFGRPDRVPGSPSPCFVAGVPCSCSLPDRIYSPIVILPIEATHVPNSRGVVSPSPSAPQRAKKPRTKPFRSLSDPFTLSEFASRLKEGIYITTLDGEIVDANPAFLEMFGVESLDELRGYRTSDFVRPEVREREMAQLERDGSVRDVEFQLTRRDGEVRTVVDSAYLSIDRDTGERFCHGILVDITQRKELQTQLLELSIRDPLTGCYNRRYLNTVTRQCEAQPKGEWGCIYLDIDHFKQYNDRNGHAEGDAILVKMARFLMRHVRAEEAVVRVGGDEFLVVLCDSDHDQTAHVVERLREAASSSAPVPFSMGWAGRRGGESFESTMIRADQQLLAVRVDERRDLQKRRKP